MRAARAVSDGARVFDSGGPEHDMSEVVAAIEAAVPGADVTFEPVSFAETPSTFNGGPLEATIGSVQWRPLQEGVSETIARFRELTDG